MNLPLPKAGLRITVVDLDPDYFEIEIRAWNERFSGTARIYAGLDQLTEFAERIEGFPATLHDQRQYEFGTRERSAAGGYGKVRFQCVDKLGHTTADAVLIDEEQDYGPGEVSLRIRVQAAAIDRFTAALRVIKQTSDQRQMGEAILEGD